MTLLCRILYGRVSFFIARENNMKAIAALFTFMSVLAAAPLHAEQTEKTMAQEMEQTGKAMKEKAKNAAEKAKKAGKDLAEDVTDAAEDVADSAEDVVDNAADAVQGDAEDMAEDAADTAEDAMDSAEDAAEEATEAAKKAIPPGMAKKDQHPSTGKGSEQGQGSRNAEEKPWWNFWD